MGQILDKLQGKEWRRKQIRRITDKIFDLVKNDVERANLTFEDLYIAVLLVYNDINKHLPGPHFDPPSKDRVRSMIKSLDSFEEVFYYHFISLFGTTWCGPSELARKKDCDVNLDGEIDREEFVRFFQRLTSDTIIVVIQPLVATLVVAPTIAMAAKRTAEGVPGVGKVVQKLPNSVYASLVTMAVVMFQRSIQEV